jgi:prepilin-type N-terminal cleavage/methylation domain-containing protein
MLTTRRGRVAAAKVRRDGRQRGFTLVELVAALVIIALLGAMTLQLQANLKYTAQVSSLEKIRVAVEANLNLARTAYLTQGLGPGNTVRVNGEDIEVQPEGTIIQGSTVQPGSPTPSGMARMLKCGTTTLVPAVEYDCAGLPGYRVESYAPIPGFMWIYPTRSAPSRAASSCGLGYSPAYRTSSTVNPNFGWHPGSVYYYYPPPNSGAC